MAIFRCKMCGGELSVIEGTSSCVCEYCGTTQTIPTVNDENIQNLFNRANTLRMKSEFDRAADIYEKILQNSPTEAEAYWGLILCKYGIEYVEDPVTYKRIPTCHRTSYDAVAADDDFKSAIKYADAAQHGIYEAEAKAIDEIQKGILAVAQKEDPYDVFICYKETDDKGERTQDSVIANDIYYQLKHEGYKAFYSAISLEDKIGSEYEPFIFSALNTAKVMLVIGTKPEYFNAVWVKNEWSRYLKIIKNDRSKVLIPCYRDMDPYELPDEFAHLQAQDMSKIGFINDLVRGIRKVIPKEAEQQASKTEGIQATSYSSNITALLKRGNMALEDQEWEKAEGFFDEVLNQDAECAEAFLGQLLATNRSHDTQAYFNSLLDRYQGQAPLEELTSCPEESSHIQSMAEKYCVPGYLEKSEILKEYEFNRTYSSEASGRQKQKELLLNKLQNEKLLVRAMSFASGETKATLEKGIKHVSDVLDERITKAKEDDEQSITRIKKAYTEHLSNADQRVAVLHDQANAQKEHKYLAATALVENAEDIAGYEKAKSEIVRFKGYKDADKLVQKCDLELTRLNEEKQIKEKAEQEARRKEEERLKNEAELRKKKKKITIRIAISAVACMIIAVVIIMVVIPNINYNNAVSLMESGDYEAAISSFEAMNGYKDSIEKIEDCKTGILDQKYDAAITLKNNGELDEAIDAFTALNGYKDSAVMIEDCKYDAAVSLKNSGEFDKALDAFTALNGYKDSMEMIEDCKINILFQKYDKYTFGAYEQDNDTGNGKEEIEWLVLDKEGSSLLLLSMYALDIQPYNTDYDISTWETCSLRKWLNEEFMKAAFSPEEQNIIISSKVTADSNPRYGYSSGNETTDKVFLLNITEADKYLGSNDAGQCQGTAYCYAQGDYKAYKGNCRWWLRTPGWDQFNSAYVDVDGSIDFWGDMVVDKLQNGVRPALWIELGS